MPGRGLGGAALTGGLSAAGGLSDLAAAAGTPSNFGKVGDAGAYRTSYFVFRSS